jgi:hypothetical protein
MSRTRGLSYAILALGIFCLAVNVAFAQEPADTYQVSYYSNALVVGPDATVHIVNPGTAITTINGNGGPTSGDLCADIYVFNNDEQEVECCSCLLTPDSERTLGIHTNLLNNPVNAGNVTNDGVIKVVSTASVTVKGAQTCPFPNGDTSISPTAGLRAWATHWQTHGDTGYSETEEEFSSAPLSSFELEYVELECSAISTSGSGKGVCSCGYGD